MSSPLLQVENLEAGYGPINVLHRLALTVNRGEIVTIIGANGAGKTTTLGCVSGIVKARAGKIVFDGRDLVADRVPAHDVVKLGLAQSPEGRKIFSRLTVRENLEMGAFTRTDPDGVRADIEKAYAMFPILQKRQSQAGGLLSGGEQQMLAIARALMARPKLLLLDEPSLGLAPQIVVQIFNVIKELNQQGMSILLVEQNARMALKVAHRGYVLETGRITFTDKAEVLLNDPRIREAYLGH
ncbi:MAG TPA: ABC transporter ATP-binding protein [Gemmata sp.]|nr:ABC transporter ATP-binding protein [Gemmata sp.]